ncbi:Acetyltransferase (GNAT) family protein [uncultured archaeon]|nr:Acetyltransferase (GNAT) family protein [uncultured archaeon]
MRRSFGDIQIEPIQHLKEFKIFYQVPFQIYHDDPNWVPPFWNEIKDFFKKKNPFWLHAECQLFIAKKNNEVIGRIAAIIDSKYCETVGEKIGYFGFFECIQDFKCANALLQTAQDWLLSKEMKVMRGPIDGRIDVGCGFSYTGFNSRPCVLSSYSPAYYIAYVKNFGMKKVKDQLFYYIDLTKPIPKKLEEKTRQSIALDVKIRPFNRLRTRKELKWWVELFLETFSDHWGFVPVPAEEVKTRFGVKQLRWFVDSRLFLIAEIKDSSIAYIWSTPDYNQIFQNMNGRLGFFQMLLFLCKKRRINVGKLHFIGVKKEFRDLNIGSLLNYKILKEMKNRGYIGAEVGWIDEENSIARTTIAITGATLYKRNRVFEKNLTV